LRLLDEIGVSYKLQASSCKKKQAAVQPLFLMA